MPRKLNFSLSKKMAMFYAYLKTLSRNMISSFCVQLILGTLIMLYAVGFLFMSFFAANENRQPTFDPIKV